MLLNIKRHIYISYTTYNLSKKNKRHAIFFIRNIIFKFTVSQWDHTSSKVGYHDHV